jgi:hypothetical protein
MLLFSFFAHPFGKYSTVCAMFFERKMQKMRIGTRQTFGLKIVEKAGICFLFYLLFILVHYISSAPLVGLFLSANQLGHALPTDV